MSLAIESVTAYVVRDDGGRVVAVFWGADAPEEAQRWTERGYRVHEIDRAELDQ